MERRVECVKAEESCLKDRKTNSEQMTSERSKTQWWAEGQVEGTKATPRCHSHVQQLDDGSWLFRDATVICAVLTFSLSFS